MLISIRGTSRAFRVTPHAEAMRMFEQPPQINPHLERPPPIDSAECFLTTFFRSSCADMSRTARDVDSTDKCRGAARLLSEIRHVW